MEEQRVFDHRQCADGAGVDALHATGANKRIDEQPFASHFDGERRAQRHAQPALVAELAVDDGDRRRYARHVSEVTGPS
jgi:hypothetical protein